MYVAVLLFSTWQPPPRIDYYPHLPPLSDLRRFPDQAEAYRQMCLYQEHIAWLGLCYDCYSGPAQRRIGEWLWQSERFRSAWEVLRDARMLSLEYQKREQLLNLKTFLGEEDYRAGRMPPAFPDGYSHPGTPGPMSQPKD